MCYHDKIVYCSINLLLSGTYKPGVRTKKTFVLFPYLARTCKTVHTVNKYNHFRHRVGGVLSFFSSRRNWDSSNPSPAGECAPSPPPPPPRFWREGVRHVTGNDQDYLRESPERLFRYLRFYKRATVGVRATYATR